MREIQHNTPEQVRSYLSEALAIVDELAPPDELRVAVFGKAADLIAGKQLFYDQADAQPVSMPLMAIPRGPRGH